LLVSMQRRTLCESSGLSESELMSSYFVGANPSIDRHVYSTTLPAADAVDNHEPAFSAMTNTAAPGYFDVSFSPRAGYYLLSYRGPDVPYQRLIEASEGGELRGFSWVIS
jgi:dipeptidyl aminopeptidase/acylaminoacyl peptidase